MKPYVLALLSLAGVHAAWADERIRLSPGPGYRLTWGTAPDATDIVELSPSVPNAGTWTLDRWFQVAPNGAAIALSDPSHGLQVYSSDGAKVLEYQAVVPAFRFSPDSQRIAFATQRGVAIETLADHARHSLAAPSGMEWLRWTGLGLVARAGGRLFLLEEDGGQRTLAALPAAALVTAAGKRVVYFQPGSFVSLDLTDMASTTVKLADRDRVVNAELSPDGSRLLFATAHHVYLTEGNQAPRQLAAVDDVRSLFFSPGGDTYLWAGPQGGKVQPAGGNALPLPDGTQAARFSHRDGELVVTTEAGVTLWDVRSGKRTVVGGISKDDGVNFAGAAVGNTGVISFYYKKSGSQKETQKPRL